MIFDKFLGHSHRENENSKIIDDDIPSPPKMSTGFFMRKEYEDFIASGYDLQKTSSVTAIDLDGNVIDL